MKKILLLLFTAAAIISCGPGMRVFSDYDKDTKFTGYKTYGWLDLKSIESRGTNPLFYNEMTDRRIKTAVNNAMAAKGCRLVNDAGELELHYHIVVEDKTSVSTEPFGYQYSPYWVNKRVNVYQYREGTLIIDLMDKKTNVLVWRGWATDVITTAAVKNPEAAINKAVEAIFKKFPFTVI